MRDHLIAENYLNSLVSRDFFTFPGTLSGISGTRRSDLHIIKVILLLVARETSRMSLQSSTTTAYAKTTFLPERRIDLLESTSF